MGESPSNLPNFLQRKDVAGHFVLRLVHNAVGTLPDFVELLVALHCEIFPRSVADGNFEHFVHLNLGNQEGRAGGLFGQQRGRPCRPASKSSCPEIHVRVELES